MAYMDFKMSRLQRRYYAGCRKYTTSESVKIVLVISVSGNITITPDTHT